jgi:hypothetical protein
LIQVPSIKQQEAFAADVERFTVYRGRAQRHMEALHAFFASLQTRAFSGML